MIIIIVFTNNHDHDDHDQVKPAPRAREQGVHKQKELTGTQALYRVCQVCLSWWGWSWWRWWWTLSGLPLTPALVRAKNCAWLTPTGLGTYHHFVLAILLVPWPSLSLPLSSSSLSSWLRSSSWPPHLPGQCCHPPDHHCCHPHHHLHHHHFHDHHHHHHRQTHHHHVFKVGGAGPGTTVEPCPSRYPTLFWSRLS